MDSILSTVLSAFVHNPILILAIIGYIVFSFLKSSKNEDADEYENSGAERRGRIWSVNMVFPFNVS